MYSVTFRSAAVVAVAALGLVGLTGCSGESRSVEAYCAVIAEHKDEYLAAMDLSLDQIGSGTEEGMLSGLFGANSALGGIKVMFQEMAEVAPKEIQVETENVVEAIEEGQSQVSDGNILGALSTVMNAAYSMEKVSDFVGQNCQ